MRRKKLASMPVCRETKIMRQGWPQFSPSDGIDVISTPSSRNNKTGKFENLSIHFPEGTVIRLRFRREQSKDISAGQCEEVHRLADIGIGLELAGVGEEAIREMEKELKPFSGLPRPGNLKR